MLEQFWNSIKDRKTIDANTNCWLYTGDTCPSTGYGRIQIDGKRLHVHRISAAYHHNLDLDNTHNFACHKCSNRKCFNPDHLYSGDNNTNQRDAFPTCKKGHDLKIHGAWASNIGRRYCKTCHTERQKLNRKIRKTALAVASNGVVAI